MDKFLIRKDVYGELIEKGYGKKDLSKLTKKQITDKNGHKRTVYVRNGEQPAAQQQPKGQEELTTEKKARYEEMLEKVKAGSDENALFVRGKGMLNKKDAIAHLEGKLGKKTVNSSAQGHLESDTPQNTDITKEDEERFGKQALSGLSGKRTAEPKHTLEVGSEVKFKRTGQPIKIKKLEQYGNTKIVVGEYEHNGKTEENRFRLDELDYEEEKPEQKKDNNPIAIGNTVKFKRTGQPIKIKDIETYGNDKVIVGEYEHNGKTETNRFRMDEISTEPTQDDMKENYLDAKNEAGKDIKENNKIENISDTIEFSPEEMKVIKNVAEKINYQPGDEGYLLNTIYSENKEVYSALTKKNQEAWDKSGKKQKTFSSTDLIKEKIKSMNGNFDSKGIIKSYKDAHAYLTKLKPSSSELKDDFEDHRDIVLKRFERGEESFDDVLKNYEKELKISVPHMVESGIMTFEEGNNYIKAWEDLKKQI